MAKTNVLFLLIVSITVISCVGNTREPGANLSVKEYPVLTLQSKDTLLSIPYVANIQAGRNVEIRPRIDGILTNIYIKEGQAVKKGQPLFKIRDGELRIELNKAIASYNSAVADAKVAKVEVERVQMLVEKQVITKTELDLVNAKYKAALARADVAQADKNAVQQRISYTNVTAPFDGVIDRIPLKEGSLVTSQSLLTTISDNSSVFAYFNISENEYFQTQNNAGGKNDISSIHLVLADGSTHPFEGELESAESEIDANTGNIAYKAKFKNPGYTLRHGASGKLLITRPLQDVILLPQKSVFEIQDKNYVFVVDQNNLVHMKPIQVSQRLADYYVVTGGIQPQDRIVFEGIQTIREGEKIIPKSV